MPRKLLWDLDAWEDYLYWQTQDKKVLGKPEPLKENLSGLWSRRIDSSNRLVYAVEVIITGRRSRQSGGGGATCPDFRSHPV